MLFTFFSFEAKGQFIENSDEVMLNDMNKTLKVKKFLLTPTGNTWGGMWIQDVASQNATSLRMGFSTNQMGRGYITAIKNATTNEPGMLMLNPEGGAVGIGAWMPTEANSEYKLYVFKGIRTEKVRVDYASNWADYVFAPNYKLRPLSEVEAFIQKNKHLPDVPSAKEIHEKGIDLGEMHKIQMQKIEELTLYILEMKKENDALKKRMEALESAQKK